MFRLVAITMTAAALLVPSSASAAGCEVLADPRERAECVARQEARNAARAEVERQVGDQAAGAATPRSAAWQDAIAEAEGFHPGDLFDEPRPLAAIVGLAWFGLVVRARWRRRLATAAP